MIAGGFVMPQEAPVTAQTYALTATATGEVRDADGNLIETVTTTTTQTITEADARALGLIPQEES